MTKNKFNYINNTSLFLCFCTIFCFLLFTKSFSQDSDIQNESSLKLKAESAILNKESGVFRFSGSVEIIFKEYKIKSDFLKATQNKITKEKKISLIEAKGNVFISNNKNLLASGDLLTFDVEKQFILIEGNVEFMQGKSLIKGKRVFVDLITENIEFDGGVNSYILE